MQKVAEAVSLGHPDKTADFISSYILDRLIEQDNSVKYAVEVMLKGNTCVLGGEICGDVSLFNLDDWVKNALRQIGYTEKYAAIWGDKAIDVSKVNVINLIGQQSPEINHGVRQNGWGDQGVFVGYACQGDKNIAKAQYLALKLNAALYAKALSSKNLGLDIKTQIVLDDDGHIETAIAAIPMKEHVDLQKLIFNALGEKPKSLIINGCGDFSYHSSVADCGVTGRKLACDFYSAFCPIGGGSPWTKDASKADVSLNLFARVIAVQLLEDYDECFVFLSSCIGQSQLQSAEVKLVKNGQTTWKKLFCAMSPVEIIDFLGLNKPVFAALCKEGFVHHPFKPLAQDKLRFVL